MDAIYQINPLPGRFRWVSVADDGSSWGMRAVQLPRTAVGDQFGPIPVEWTPETISRPVADFPNFITSLLCVSSRAKNALDALFSGCGEWVTLKGLDEEFHCFHCLKSVDAVDWERTNALMSVSVYTSFHSPRFIPALRKQNLTSADVFRVSGSISKFFVSQNFKSIYDEHGFMGLEFFAVELADR